MVKSNLDPETPPLGTPVVPAPHVDEPSKPVDVPLTPEQAEQAGNARVTAIRAAAKPFGKKLPDELVRACIFRNVKADDAALKFKDFVDKGYTWVDRQIEFGIPPRAKETR